MAPDTQDENLQESMKQVMQTLPRFIRDYLSEGKYIGVAQSLMSKYRLRVDQAGILERELLLLLMGIENPAEFSQALAEEAKIDNQTLNSLIAEINEQVFVPLRKQEEEMTKALQASQGSGLLPVKPATRPKVVIFNQGTPKPPAQPAPAHIAPLPPKTIMPSLGGGTLHDAVQAALSKKMSEQKLMLEDHEEPHIEIPSRDIPAPSRAIPAPAPVRSEPSLPAAPTPVPTPAPQAAAPAPVVPPTPRPALATPGIPQVSKTPPAPITSYSADPYREPIDES